jgi:hypothetical protein
VAGDMRPTIRCSRTGKMVDGADCFRSHGGAVSTQVRGGAWPATPKAHETWLGKEKSRAAAKEQRREVEFCEEEKVGRDGGVSREVALDFPSRFHRGKGWWRARGAVSETGGGSGFGPMATGQRRQARSAWRPSAHRAGGFWSWALHRIGAAWASLKQVWAALFRWAGPI